MQRSKSNFFGFVFVCSCFTTAKRDHRRYLCYVQCNIHKTDNKASFWEIQFVVRCEKELKRELKRELKNMWKECSKRCEKRAQKELKNMSKESWKESFMLTRTACSRFQDCSKRLARWRAQFKIIKLRLLIIAQIGKNCK